MRDADDNLTFRVVNGGTFCCLERGVGTAIVFLHGTALDRRMWSNQVAAFSERYRCIAYDMRGFGRSSKASPGYSHVEDLRELLKSLDIERAHLVGASRGGRVSINYCLTHPATVSSLVLSGANITGLPLSPDYAHVRMSVARAYASGGVNAARSAWIGSDLFTSARDSEPVGTILRKMVADYDGWHWRTDLDPEREPQPPAIHRLESLMAPTIALVGAGDIPHFRHAAEVIAKRGPNATRRVLDGAGHLCNMERWQLFNAVLSEFYSANNF
jgi:3-oxoadipate enol-lactonase